MLQMMSKFFISVMLLMLFASTGCHGGVDSRQMFIDHLRSMEGKKFHDFQVFSRVTSLATQNQLSNGNVEYRYDMRKGECIRVFEIDPKTDVIVKAWFIDGVISACKWYP